MGEEGRERKTERERSNYMCVTFDIILNDS